LPFNSPMFKGSEINLRRA